jgi:hypothetical protein
LKLYINGSMDYVAVCICICFSLDRQCCPFLSEDRCVVCCARMKPCSRALQFVEQNAYVGMGAGAPYGPLE